MELTYHVIAFMAVILPLGASPSDPRGDQSNAADIECKIKSPEAQWRVSCNWCSCFGTGYAACTRKGCPPDLALRLENEDQCTADAEWRRGCDWCHCVDGKPECTTGCPTEKTSNATSTTLHGRQSESDCIPTSEGARWRKSCNWCSCNENGESYCTRRACIPFSEAESRSDTECEGDAKWKKDCNWCECQHGQAICSTNPCNKPEVTKRNPNGEPHCVFTSETARWRDSCNWCRCNENGISLCTRMACAPAIVLRLQNDPECEGDAKWRKGCNWCQCIDGTAECTTNSCDAPTSLRVETQSCEAISKGSNWREDCNVCQCSEGRAICTRKLCSSGQNNEEQPECSGWIRWKRDCNWCDCVKGKAVCSALTCSKDSQSRKGGEGVCQSRGSGRWQVECNWCKCSNGLGLCTKRGCNPQMESRGPPLCEGDVTWKNDCNWCRCVNGKAICTDYICGRALGVESCIEGESWVEDCNTCFCLGGVTLCTKEACLKEKPAISHPLLRHRALQVISKVSTADKFERCVDGSRWKEKCNWCSCLNDTVACTLKGCLPDAPEEEPLCEDGSIWKRDCNICNCVDGLPLCTEKHCEASTAPNIKALNLGSEVPISPNECKPGSQWRKDCNWCFCAGGIGACTLKGCISGRSETGPECRGNSEWLGDKCMWCKCKDEYAQCEPIPGCNKESGTLGVELTDGFIIKTETVSPQEKPQCIGNGRWKKSCNWCSCSAGVGACTLKGCLPGHSDAPPQCEDDIQWQDDGCMWCKCQGGAATCAPRPDCELNTEQVSPVEDGVCNEGSSWTKDCNVCLCKNNIQVCTKRACINSLDAPKPKCVEGKRWDDGCNSCTCFKGKPACTRKLCLEIPQTFEIPELCHLPPIQPGTDLCGGTDMKWTFDEASGQCQEVTYGGCGGTENLFLTQDECQNTCQVQPRPKMASPFPQTPKERCFLKPEVGPCFALLERYFFNPTTSRCETFYYGGCQGNQNNFETIQECYGICGEEPIAIGPDCDRTKCDWKRLQHYLAQGCQPVYEDGSCCPTQFSCKTEAERGISTNTCYYKEQNYQSQESVPVENVCLRGCHCSSFNKDTPSEIVCGHVDCPFSYKRPQLGCKLLYSIEKCCSTGEECLDPGLLVINEPPNTCNWRGKSWKFGDIMDFDDEPCQKCICSANFTHPNGPGCHKINCNLEVGNRAKLLQGCTPIYFEKKCCPIPEWICPDDKRITGIKSSRKMDQSFSAFCKLGNYWILVGGFLKLSVCDIECYCKTPPAVTCVQYRSCERLKEAIIQRENTECPKVKCPNSCTTQTDAFTGCPECICPGLSFTCREPTCPHNCSNHSIELDQTLGCKVCKCK